VVSLLRLLASVGYAAVRTIGYAATAVAVRGMPASLSAGLTSYDSLILDREASGFFVACFGFAAALLLSLWVFRAGPFRNLAKEFTLLLGRDDDRTV
jgi:hypothetical protein